MYTPYSYSCSALTNSFQYPVGYIEKCNKSSVSLPLVPTSATDDHIQGGTNVIMVEGVVGLISLVVFVIVLLCYKRKNRNRNNIRDATPERLELTHRNSRV